MICVECTQPEQWEEWLKSRRFSPFLQSYTMGEVYTSIGQQVFRFQLLENSRVIGQCQAIVVPARRGRHIVVQYGPVFIEGLSKDALFEAWEVLLHSLTSLAKTERALCIRMSPFYSLESVEHSVFSSNTTFAKAPLHLLAEHVWYLPLTQSNYWQTSIESTPSLSADAIFSSCRSTVRNLVRRAEKDGVTIVRSDAPESDVEEFIRLHDETRKRHNFTPYSNAFFRAQVAHFSQKNECTVYMARYENTVIAASIHMHYGGETSYHHGASSSAYSKLPSSYALQWRAICDALERNDAIYNFWGIAPVVQDETGKWNTASKTPHPFAGVTTFKTGFGGTLLSLSPCMDLPTHSFYKAMRTVEVIRKWKRGF
jgi:lipid II:glycine glycyltransferase (peptidoglycan interpeptide bridge formation enzyme)